MRKDLLSCKDALISHSVCALPHKSANRNEVWSQTGIIDSCFSLLRRNVGSYWSAEWDCRKLT